MYLNARACGIQPSEFWDMTLPELITEIEANRPRDPTRDYAGTLTQGDIDDLRAWDESF